MTPVRSVYRVLRSILFTAVLTALGLLALLYVFVSVPAVQRAITTRAEKELTSLLGGRVEIGEVNIFPFNEVRLQRVSVYTPTGERCVSVGRLAAGIDLWSLLLSGDIVITYAEIISLNARVEQAVEDGPLNIQFIFDALAPKKKNEPTAPFRVTLHNVVIRKSTATFDRMWIPRTDAGHFDPNHLSVSNLRADVLLPLLANDDFTVDVKRLALDEQSGLSVEKISFLAHITPRRLSLSRFELALPRSTVNLSDFDIDINGYSDIVPALSSGNYSLRISSSEFTPADITCFAPILKSWTDPLSFSIHLSGNLDDARVSLFADAPSLLELHLQTTVKSVLSPANLAVALDRFDLKATSTLLHNLAEILPQSVSHPIDNVAAGTSRLNLSAVGLRDIEHRMGQIDLNMNSDCGSLTAAARGEWSDSSFGGLRGEFNVVADALNVDRLTASAIPLSLTGSVSGRVNRSGKTVRDLTGSVTASVADVRYGSAELQGLELKASYDKSVADLVLSSDSEAAHLNLSALCSLSGPLPSWQVRADLQSFQPGLLGLRGFGTNDKFSGLIDIDMAGNNVDNLTGVVSVTDFNYHNSKSDIFLSDLSLSSDIDEDRMRHISLNSDVVNGELNGRFNFAHMIGCVRGLLSHSLPSLIKGTESVSRSDSDCFADVMFNVKADESFFKSVGSNFRPGVDMSLRGSWRESGNEFGLNVEAPYLVQGRDKLIKNLMVRAEGSESSPLAVSVRADYPLKNDYAGLDVNLTAQNDCVAAGLKWIMSKDASNRGDVKLDVLFGRDLLTKAVTIAADIHPSEFNLNGEKWIVSPAQINYGDKVVSVDGLNIGHDNQFINIEGRASAEPLDFITVKLAGVDLDYVFDILNINNVDFGGTATGTAKASSLFSGVPMAFTDGLFVRNISYNGCVLGDAEMESHWDHEQKMVAINADITAPDEAWATVRGGVYVTRDSLSFDFNTRKIDIRMLQPFMSGFTSEVSGLASGHLKLAGTFADVDLVGRVMADTITMKVDYTNVCYSGSDSVLFMPGRISIPHLRLYDRFGNSALLRGDVRHNYLHDASFDFDITDAHRLLAYDTDAHHNPKWYGRVFGDGSVSIHGVPGLVSLSVNMKTSPKSTFNLVLDETQTAVDYTFLTFTDRRKEQRLAEMVVEETFEDRFRRRKTAAKQGRPDLFVLDMSLDVGRETNMVIVMDPKAGDRIVANGTGGLRMHYDSDSDDFTIYGKYTLDRGNYNFSLQDLILKNFKIEPGSSIAFNGDPLAGILDIKADYRVNTNLTDLDRSFANDPDLKRTGVPVDAILKVRGDIHAPEIGFDLQLPTVTSEVERKVRSIISTDDMMNRQIIYLLALNRFYTPEYMGAEQGGEFASVASSTLSSQISNIISSLTDKVSVSPTFKSEKDDFSDLEFDVALSSALLDNRLLLNGNFGYRDRSTSQTTFVGDFDLEYLLSKDGKLRLKAYNHFNDASYYLKSALTTQGIGIVYRKDFNNPLNFVSRMFRRRKANGAVVPVESGEIRRTKK